MFPYIFFNSSIILYIADYCSIRNLELITQEEKIQARNE